MTTPVALTCPWCGAPLPGVVAGQTLATCAYCGSTASLGGPRAQKAQPATLRPHRPPTRTATRA